MKKKTTNFVWRALGIAGFLGILIYFAASMAGYFVDPLTTTYAYTYQSDESVMVAGYLVREETVLPGGTDLTYVRRSEGEKVSKGSAVAVTYHSQSALDQALELEELQTQLDRLQYAQNVSSGSQEALRLETTIADAIFDLKSAMASENYLQAEETSETLQTLVLKRDYTYSRQEDLEVQIVSLEEQIAALSASAGQNSTAITAERSGYYSSLVDGYEAVLTPEGLAEMTVAEFEAIAPQAADTAAVGKMIYGTYWYYVTAITPEDAKGMYEGMTVTLRFVSGLEKDVSMTVERLGTEENGKRILVLKANQYLSSTTLLRDQNAQIIYRSYTGIRVPETALRVWERTEEDEDGNTTVTKLTGVYCRMGRTARFKPVEVIYEGEDYLLVTPTPEDIGTTSESTLQIYTLRAGDEVIVTARGLYDGKVIG